MDTIAPDQLLAQLQWRYATKRFDPDRTIPPEIWSTLEQTLVLTPSSYGLQPWKFLIVTDADLKENLVAASYHQRQVADCSHLVVMAARRCVSEADVDRLIATICEMRGIPPEKLEGYRQMMLGDIVHGDRSKDAVGWAKLQCYIALGNFMTAAALLGVDTCPMEGFNAGQFDEALGLTERDLTTAVLCPAGYRSPEDRHGVAAKVRYPASELIEHL